MKVYIQYVFLLALPLVWGQAYNPTILEDSRYEPKTDGTFGFLYRTEDGIAHGAKSNGDGIIYGRYTYTDPTGLKVNFNYNAGSRATPGYNYNEQVQYVPKAQNVVQQNQVVPQQQQQPIEQQPATSYNPPQQVYRNQRESYIPNNNNNNEYFNYVPQPQQRQINQNDLYSNYS